MNPFKELEKRWSDFERNWSLYIKDFERRVQFLIELKAYLDSDRQDIKHLQQIIANADNEHQEYELSIYPYLSLAEQLEIKEKYPVILSRLLTFKQNIKTIKELQALIH